MPYIETETAEPVTYTDNGPGGVAGCDEDNIRPKGAVAGTYEPLKKGDPPHKDDTIPINATVCFYDKNGQEYMTESDPITSENDKVKLKADGVTTEIRSNWLVNAMLQKLGMETIAEFLEDAVKVRELPGSTRQH